MLLYCQSAYTVAIYKLYNERKSKKLRVNVANAKTLPTVQLLKSLNLETFYGGQQMSHCTGIHQRHLYCIKLFTFPQIGCNLDKQRERISNTTFFFYNTSKKESQERTETESYNEKESKKLLKMNAKIGQNLAKPHSKVTDFLFR